MERNKNVHNIVQIQTWQTRNTQIDSQPVSQLLSQLFVWFGCCCCCFVRQSSSASSLALQIFFVCSLVVVGSFMQLSCCCLFACMSDTQWGFIIILIFLLFACLLWNGGSFNFALNIEQVYLFFDAVDDGLCYFCLPIFQLSSIIFQCSWC